MVTHFLLYWAYNQPPQNNIQTYMHTNTSFINPRGKTTASFGHTKNMRRYMPELAITFRRRNSIMIVDFKEKIRSKNKYLHEPINGLLISWNMFWIKWLILYNIPEIFFRARKFDLIKQKIAQIRLIICLAIYSPRLVYTLTRALKLPLSPKDTKNLRSRNAI